MNDTLNNNDTIAELRKAIAELRAAADNDSNDAEIEAGHHVADLAERLIDDLAGGRIEHAPRS